jgi:UDP-N-acetylglucosamine 2-epimerase (non-hydrolysing)
MKKAQSLEYLTKTIFPRICRVMEQTRPDWVVVQGDTTTVFLVSLAAFYKKVKVAHVEAGLRTNNRYFPFPEEMNRRLVSSLADVHFAPTERAKENLLKEFVQLKQIYVTGNTGIDALLWISRHNKKDYPQFKKIDFSKKLILVTAHRRESFGKPLKEMFHAFIDIIKSDRDAEIIYPVHYNPNVREKALKILNGKQRIHLVNPVSYEELVYLMKNCYFILTDSGGIQEEAPSLKKPVLVMRDETERTEGIELGISKLTGRSKEKIVHDTLELLNSEKQYNSMINGTNPYGDGKAGQRICRILKKLNKCA